MTTETKRATKAIATEIREGKLFLTFGDGEGLVVDPAGLSAEIREMAALHGLKQKLADAAAIERDPDTGRSATLEMKKAAVKEVFDRITSPDGTWNKNRESGEGGGTGGLLFRALCEVSPEKAPETIRAWLATLTPKDQAALRAVPAIAEAIARMKKADEGAAKAGSDLLAGFLAAE